MEVGRTATEIRFESVEIGLRTVCRPGLVVEAALYLVGLLIVLVRPHVVGEGAGEAVVGKAFEAVPEHRRAHYRERHFKREHHFDYGAELRSLRWVESGEVLVGREDAVGESVVAVEFGELMKERLPVFIFTAYES